MNELTIEEKAKAYDYAVNKAKELILNENGVVRVDKPLFDELFPSKMEESEDERIRKELLDHIRHSAHNTPADKFNTWVAWLKKQGESDETKAKVFLINKGYPIDANGVFPTYEEMYNIIREGLEQQSEQILANIAKTCKDEQKPNPYSGTSFDYDGHTWGMCARDNGIELLLDGELKAFLSLEKSFIYPIHPQPELAPKSALEAAKEEKVDNANKVEPKDYNDIDPHFGKPIDKVVPKFKVGDWVVYCGKPYQITGLHNDTFTLTSCDGSYFFNNVKSTNEPVFHLWSIADAEDGDVLVASDGSIFLFAGVVDCACKYYVALTICNDVKINKEVDGGYWETSRAVHPATKEQRDLLFAKMKEAGYEWDDKKKEPKKIEDELIADVEIPFGAKDSELEEVFYSIPNGFHAEIEGDKVVIKKGEKKPLSEEDERKLNKIIDIFEEIKVGSKSVYCGDVLELQNWLKLIKERMI